MANPTEAQSAKSSGKKEPAMDDGTRMAYERTVLAHERTLMAWLRTAVSLITFGFTIYKFFALELGTQIRQKTHQIIGPRQFAMIMISIGLFALIVATLQNIQYRQSLRREAIEVRLSLTSMVAAMISGLGLLAMASVLFRW